MNRHIPAAGGFASFLFNVPFGPRPVLDNPENLGQRVLERVQANHTETKSLLEKADGRLGKTETALAEIKTRGEDTDARLLEIEQKMARRGTPGGDSTPEPTAGEALVASEQYKALAASAGQKGRAAVQVKAVSLITSGTGSGASLIAPDYRPEAVILPRRRMTIRSLIAPGQTAGSSVLYPRQTLRQLNAGTVAEAALKPQSDINFELVTAPVTTIAHWMLASRQVLEDAPQLQSIIDGELRYGIDLNEEAQFLYGDGTGVNFLGIVPQAQPYQAPPGSPTTGLTRIDILALALLQAELALLPATGIVMNPADWRMILLTKDGMGRYIMGDPLGQNEQSIWGIPVVPTLAMQPGKFLVGAFRDGAQVFDRTEAEVLVSSEDGDNFRKNLVTVLGERRAAMTVKRPQAFVYGTFPTSN